MTRALLPGHRSSRSNGGAVEESHPGIVRSADGGGCGCVPIEERSTKRALVGWRAKLALTV